ncbi:MAG TPA: hypothetical protein VFH51_09165 [Myxococcota bacterium]|nr:hypothetical protein [Myxococcota bacterium]
MRTPSFRRPRTPLGASTLLGVALLAGSPSCKKSADDAASGHAADAAAGGVEDVTIRVEADKSRILQEESALKARQRDFESEKARLERERAEIEEKKATVSQADRASREKLEAAERALTEQQKALRDRSDSFEAERSKLETEKSQLLERISKMTQTKGGLTLEQREEAIARRERDVAQREKDVAAREREAARGLADVGKLLDEVRGGVAGRGAGSAKAGLTPSAANAAATRSSLNKVERSIHVKMDGKGILLDDLPPTVRDLSNAAAAASKSNDYPAAQEALTQMQQAVDAIAINHAFVQAKMARINRQFEDKKVTVDEAKQKKIQGLLAEASDSFSDGRYDRANKKINQIFSLLQGK